ncbi:hypothetical protein Goshw_025488 [Gossypium schwendimanii]|uniref:Uncharacterized protein n=1 Tax=Gossypium schwendimanii TaxID=34291 RepID=A0A7J9LZY2_GOSSC|nr:hypothetical protein [Gossypium schwendimanii]
MNLFSTIGAQISGSVWTLANVKADKTYVFNCPQVLAEKGSFLLGSTCACRPGVRYSTVWSRICGNNGGRGRRRALPPLLRGAKRKIRPRVFELEFKPDGKLCYANNSNYKNDTMIRKEVFLVPAVLKECRRIIAERIVKTVNNI